MIKVKDGYAKLIGVSALGAANQVLLSNGSNQTVGNASGSIPLNNGTVNVNLNADLLDGVHLMGKGGTSGVMRSWTRGTYTTAKQYFGNGNVVVIDPQPTDDSSLWANTTIFSVGDLEARSHQLAFGYNDDVIKYRRVSGASTAPIYNNWRTLAFTNSNITGNAASATKLQTARNLWGKSFDGTADVYGLITIGQDLANNPAIKFYKGEYIDGYGNIKLYSDSSTWSVGHKDTVASGVGLFVEALGNVGIGTRAPIHKLQVAGAGVFNNTGSTTYTTNGITIGAGDVAERYITCYGKTGVSYINVGYGPALNNSGEFFFHYVSSGSTNNYSGVGIWGGANQMYLYPNYTKFKKPLVMPAELYGGNYAINMSNSNIVGLNAIFTADLADSGAEGYQFKRTNGNYDSIWCKDGYFYFSPDGNTDQNGSYGSTYTILHTGNYAGTLDSRYVNVSGDTMTGALNFANGTWNAVGDDSAIGDCNRAGLLGIKSLNNNLPGIVFFNSSGTQIGSLYSDANVLKWNEHTVIHSGNLASLTKTLDSIGLPSSTSNAANTAWCKFARITFNDSSWSIASGYLFFGGADNPDNRAILVYHFRSGSTATTLSIANLHWLVKSYSNATVIAVKAADNVYDLYTNNSETYMSPRIYHMSAFSSKFAWSVGSWTTTKPTAACTSSDIGRVYYATSAESATTASNVVVNNSDYNQTYRMVWHSGNKLYGTGGIYCNPSTDCLYASHYYETSDVKYKTNIQSISGIDNIPKLREFDWKESGSKGYGFIAQELEEQGYLELVNTDEQGEKTVNYSAALSLTVAKLQNKIEEIEKENKELRDEIDNLKNNKLWQS